MHNKSPCTWTIAPQKRKKESNSLIFFLFQFRTKRNSIGNPNRLEIYVLHRRNRQLDRRIINENRNHSRVKDLWGFPILFSPAHNQWIAFSLFADSLNPSQQTLQKKKKDTLKIMKPNAYFMHQVSNHLWQSHNTQQKSQLTYRLA